MNTPVTEIIAHAKSLAGMEDDGDGLVSPEEWERWATVENRALVNLVTRRGVILAESRYDITADGSTSYPLTDPDTIDPMAIVGLYEYRDGLYRRVNRADALDTSTRSTVNAGSAVWYRLTRPGGSSNVWTLSLSPRPETGTYYLFYVPSPPALVESNPTADQADSVNYPAGWDEWISLRMARRGLLKEETQPASLMSLLAEVEETIVDQANGMVLGGGVRVRNRDAWESPWRSTPQHIDWLREWQFL